MRRLTSDMGHQTSEVTPLMSDVRHLISDPDVRRLMSDV